MSKLHWTAKDVFGLPGMPDWARYASIDDDARGFYIYESKPDFRGRNSIWDNGGASNRVELETDYTGDWKDSLLERPQEVKVGDFAKGWGTEIEPDDKSSDVFYGYVCEISGDDYWISGTGWRKNVRVMNPPTRKD